MMGANSGAEFFSSVARLSCKIEKLNLRYCIRARNIRGKESTVGGISLDVVPNSFANSSVLF